MSSGNACWIWSKRGCSRGSFPAGWRRPEVDAEPTKRSDSRGGGQNAEQSQEHCIDRDSGTEGSNPAPSTGESGANLNSENSGTAVVARIRRLVAARGGDHHRLAAAIGQFADRRLVGHAARETQHVGHRVLFAGIRIHAAATEGRAWYRGSRSAPATGATRY